MISDEKKKSNVKEGTEQQIKSLKNLRKKLGMNRTEFAKSMGIPLRTVEEWEAGNRKMPEYVLRLLIYYALGKEIVFKDSDIDFQGMLDEEDTCE